MSRNSGLDHGLLAICCLAVFFLNLGAARLFDEDEPKNAECAREMFERGDAIVPSFNYELRTDKPIMIYWLLLASLQFLGISEFAVRIPSALAASLSVMLVYHIGGRLFDRRVGFWGAVMLASSMMFVTVGRACTPDATLIAFTTLSLFVFVKTSPSFGSQRNSSGANSTGATLHISQNGWKLAALYAAMGLAVLTKGPVGFLLPCAVIGLYLLVMSDRQPLSQELSWKKPLKTCRELGWQSLCLFAPRRFAGALLSMKPWILIATVCAVALPWYIAVSLQTDGAWLNGFLGQHNLGRFTSAMEGHRGPVFYYVPMILAGFFPWSVILPASLLESWRCSKSTEPDHRGTTFLLCWAAVYIVFFSIAQTKLPNYVLPCYPAIALLSARAVVRWSEGAIHVPNWITRLGLGSLIAVGGLLTIALPVFSHFFLPGYAALGGIGLLPLLAGCTAWRWTRQEKRERALKVLGLGAVGLMVVIFACTVPWISQAQESPQIGRASREFSTGTGSIATYRYFAPNLPFYAKQRVERFQKPEDLQAWIDDSEEIVLCLKAKNYQEIAETLGDSFVVQKKIDRFLRNEEILIVTKKPAVDSELDRPRITRQSAASGVARE